jgi:ElaB/YqjD/DUF883 family membrane-anchored ribosome-binding protein
MDTTSKRGATSDDTILDTYELVQQLAGIRGDLQSLTSTVGRLANQQLGRVKDQAMETANQVEDVIRQNPLSAVGIGLGVGFLLGVFTRR